MFQELLTAFILVYCRFIAIFSLILGKIFVFIFLWQKHLFISSAVEDVKSPHVPHNVSNHGRLLLKQLMLDSSFVNAFLVNLT